MKLLLSLALVCVACVPAETRLPKHEVSYGFQIEGKTYLSTASVDELRQSGSSNPGVDKLKCSIDDAIRAARAVLKSITKDADDWECYDIRLERQPYTDYWNWVVYFYSPNGVFDTVGNDNASIGVLVNGKAFRTSLDDE
jgi:hypothetical protein